MDILIVSSDDVCRSRMAQEIMTSFGRGMKFRTAGLSDGRMVPDVVVRVMEQNGYEVSRRKSASVADCVSQSWGAVITLCPEAEAEVKQLDLQAEIMVHLEYADPLASADESVQQSQIEEVLKAMYHDLFELYRDQLSDLLLPRCSCGANTYCRCE